MDWPPKYGATSATSPAGGSTFPPRGWPSRSQLDYVRVLVVVVLLLLAMPYLVGKLVTNPGAVVNGVGRRVVTKGA